MKASNRFWRYLALPISFAVLLIMGEGPATSTLVPEEK
jgi:hypothetical protein